MKKISILLSVFSAVVLSVCCTREEVQEPYGEGGIVVNISVDGMMTKGEDDIPAGFIYLFDDVNQAPFSVVAIDGSGTTAIPFSTFGSNADKVKRTTVFVVAGSSTQVSSPTSLSDIKSRPLSSPLFLDDSGTKVKADPNFYMTGEGTFEKVDDSTTACNLTLKRLAAKLTLELDYATSITTTGNWKFKEGEELASTTTWVPMTSGKNTRVSLVNAVKNSVLGINLTSSPAIRPATFTTFTYDYVYMNGASVSAPFYTYPVKWEEGTDDEPYIKVIQPWRYRTVVVKEGKDVVVDENVVELYYKVMVPSSLSALESNKWYKPKVTLNILGGEADRPTVIGSDGLTVMNWVGVTSADDMGEVSISPSDYLIVERSSFEVSNGNPLVINFASSGDVTLTVNRIYKQVYTNSDIEDREIYPSKHAKVNDVYDASWFTKAYDSGTKTGTLTLNHTLSSDFDADNFAARPYIYKLTLTKPVDPSVEGSVAISQNITITQNPPVMAVGIKSTGWVCVNGTTSKFGTTYRARTSSTDNPLGSTSNASTATSSFINVQRYSPNDLYAVNTYAYLGSNANNCSQYMVLVSVAPKSGLFVEDPRIDLSGYSQSTDADGLYGIVNMHRNGGGNADAAGVTYNHDGSPLTNDATEQGYIEYYKPARKSNSSNNIAPEFLVASSYGKANSMPYENAVLRCNSYQEDGYPAGRWRIPTEQEIEYCMKLNDKGAIPDLFYEKATNGMICGYRASSGRRKTSYGWIAEGRPNSDGDSKDTQNPEGNAFVRCVYDTWYWGRAPKDDLKDGSYSDGTGSYQKYKWSGYKLDYIVNK